MSIAYLDIRKMYCRKCNLIRYAMSVSSRLYRKFKIQNSRSRFKIQNSGFKIQNSKFKIEKSYFFPSLTFTSIIPFVYLPPQTPSSVPPRALGVQQLKLPTTWTAYNESIPHHFSLALSSFVPIHPVSRIDKAVIYPLMLI